MAAADKPFRFPATFTFVVRSFSVLDGIGKSLSPRFDITEISAPYARGLLLEGAPQKAALQKELKKRLGKQVQGPGGPLVHAPAGSSEEPCMHPAARARCLPGPELGCRRAALILRE